MRKKVTSKKNNQIDPYKFLLFFTFFIISNTSLIAQVKNVITHDDSMALENVIIEKYYISESSDYIDTTGCGVLPKGSVTYRIFIDMKQGYSLQAVYGDKTHELSIETSTSFYNNTVYNAETGFNVGLKKIDRGAIAFDSWITMGAAAQGMTGIPLSEDNEGFSLLKSKHSLEKKDGLQRAFYPTSKFLILILHFLIMTVMLQHLLRITVAGLRLEVSKVQHLKTGY